MKSKKGAKTMTTYTATPAKMHSGHDIRDASGSMVAIVHNPKADPAKGAKIAALMAAAPDLLLFSRDIVAAVKNEFASSHTLVEYAARLEAAITRATGAAQ
jgi:hypothetical protein